MQQTKLVNYFKVRVAFSLYLFAKSTNAESYKSFKALTKTKCSDFDHNNQPDYPHSLQICISYSELKNTQYFTLINFTAVLGNLDMTYSICVHYKWVSQ